MYTLSISVIMYVFKYIRVPYFQEMKIWKNVYIKIHSNIKNDIRNALRMIMNNNVLRAVRTKTLGILIN